MYTQLVTDFLFVSVAQLFLSEHKLLSFFVKLYINGLISPKC